MLSIIALMTYDINLTHKGQLQDQSVSWFHFSGRNMWFKQNQTTIISFSDHLHVRRSRKDGIEMVQVQFSAWSDGFFYLPYWIRSVIWKTAIVGSCNNDGDAFQWVHVIVWTQTCMRTNFVIFLYNLRYIENLVWLIGG